MAPAFPSARTKSNHSKSASTLSTWPSRLARP